LNTRDEDTKLYYWREGNQEVDFVLAKGKKLTAIEVKSAPKPVVSAGLNVFAEKYPHARKILVGAGGVPLAEFLSQPAEDWLE
jgi:predicted AAA+ superfamily ATPase